MRVVQPSRTEPYRPNLFAPARAAVGQASRRSIGWRAELDRRPLMRLDDSPRQTSAATAALAALLLTMPIPALAQPAGSLEARVKALEARVTAIESRSGAGTPAAAPDN